jgi:hypothetical protein
MRVGDIPRAHVATPGGHVNFARGRDTGKQDGVRGRWDKPRSGTSAVRLFLHAATSTNFRPISQSPSTCGRAAMRLRRRRALPGAAPPRRQATTRRRLIRRKFRSPHGRPTRRPCSLAPFRKPRRLPPLPNLPATESRTISAKESCAPQLSLRRVRSPRAISAFTDAGGPWLPCNAPASSSEPPAIWNAVPAYCGRIGIASAHFMLYRVVYNDRDSDRSLP